ncbi:Solute carrier organic anion transporter family member 4C1 [Hypsibius exemplaris]|uniref:Solute carrier organic anion transporter family member n=1 Tax=Hypsibius exemplaris TaxID=2072580 RepID=A0A1W0WJL3_HYPEX|nr:Solute carrier organic anion transporter family member 4C1 [Hypsibius exemplaris]
MAEQLKKRLSRIVSISIPDDPDLQCNFFGWRPKWLQIFNNMKVFMLCFVTLGIFRGISHSYFSAMLPSIEKRFGFSSQSVGTVKAMSDVSHLMSALFIAHFGGAGHRPRWIAGGSLLVGLGFLLMAATEIFFPASNISSLATVLFTSSDKNEPLCNASRNESMHGAVDCRKRNDDHIGPLIVLGVAEFIMGLGSTASMILGMPFVDDNVQNKNSPFYFAVSFSGFIFGPVIGLALSAAFNTIYFDFSHPDFRPSDPRWISAWYLGFIISGLGTCLMGLVVSCFPSAIAQTKKHLFARKNAEAKAKEIELAKNGETGVAIVQSKNPARTVHKAKPVTLKDLPINLKRLFTNSIYITKLGGQLLSAFALSGYMSFMQKFLKEQYHLPQSTTNLAGGLPPIFAGFLGIAIGSLIIRHFKLRPKNVCLLMAASSFIASACYFSVIGMGCEKQYIIGVDDVSDPYNITGEDLCVNSHACNCIDFQFSPVCDTETGKTYVSACVAGCRGARRRNGTKYYSDCACTGGGNGTNGTTSTRAHELYVLKMAGRKSNHTGHGRSVIRGGVCPKSCPNFIYYVVAMGIAKFFMGIPMSGILMIQFRVVDVDLKSLASGVSTVIMSVFGHLPAPIVIGKLIDSACRLWQTNKCGERGACWSYNVAEFRVKLHVIVGVARLINCLIEIIIAYKVRNLSFDRNIIETVEPSPDSSKTSSQIDLVPSPEEATAVSGPAEYNRDAQRAEILQEARRKSIFIPDGVVS